MKHAKTKTAIGILSTLITYVSVNSWLRSTHPNLFIWSAEDREDTAWVNSSRSWLDRKACRWLGVCGSTHVRLVGKHFGKHIGHDQHSVINTTDEWDWQNAWTTGTEDPKKDELLRQIPDYVFEYAPLVYLFSGEQFWPCDIAEHLYHTTSHLNYTPLPAEYQNLTLNDLDELNRWDHGRNVFLTSNDNPEDRPEWLEGAKNIPVPPSTPDDIEDEDLVHYPGRTPLQGLKDSAEDLKEWFGGGDHQWDDTDYFDESRTAKKALQQLKAQAEGLLHDELKREARRERGQESLRGGRSDAPAVLITVEKGDGIVDAFWFFFYSFNLGNSVFNIRFGNHVGDWEHTAIRFIHGQPKAVFFSEHNFGSAYGYEAVEKIGKRPVIYSATGTHAMYATAGSHPYVLPGGILHDQTDKGPLWDPLLNSHAYTYDSGKDILRSSTLTPKAPIGWFYFAGHWGDKFYPLGDNRQYRFAGQYHYVNGPLGPRFKNLGRKKICGGPDSAPCVIKHWLMDNARAQKWQSTGEDADAFSAAAAVAITKD